MFSLFFIVAFILHFLPLHFCFINSSRVFSTSAFWIFFCILVLKQTYVSTVQRHLCLSAFVVMGGVSFNVKAPKKIEAHIQDFFGWRFGVNRNKPCIIYGRTKREFIWSEEKKAKESELVLRRCDTFQRRHAVKF